MSNYNLRRHSKTTLETGSDSSCHKQPIVTVTNDFGSYKAEHPKYLRRVEERLKKLKRAFSRKQKGSKNSNKVR
jgi:hypothetical protein